MTSITKETLEFLALDEQGAGRNAAEQYFVMERLPNHLVRRAGIRRPDSGRKELHPHVTNSLEHRLGKEIVDKKIHLLEPSHINPFTLVLVLADLEQVPQYVYTQAFDILHAPVNDPFPTLENSLEPAMTQMFFYAILLEYVVNNCFDQLGTSRDQLGNIIPRALASFQPADWEPEYSLRHLPNLYSKSSITNTFTHARNPSKSLFEADWGERSALTQTSHF